MDLQNEKTLQDAFAWSRAGFYADYNRILAFYQAKACMEHARGDSLLDMPCGDGTLLEMLSPGFRRIVGVDASGVHLENARKRLPAGEFHEALLEEFDTEERFSTITMINVLEHVVDPVLALKRAARLLSEDGVLLVHVPNARAVNRQIAVKMGTLLDCEELSPFDIQVAGHRRSYVLSTLCSDMQEAGLKILCTGGVFYKMLSTPQMDWFLKNGLWDSGYGWGRTRMEAAKDWKAEFCRACYEYGREHPEDCNIVYACAVR